MRVLPVLALLVVGGPQGPPEDENPNSDECGILVSGFATVRQFWLAVDFAASLSRLQMVRGWCSPREVEVHRVKVQVWTDVDVDQLREWSAGFGEIAGLPVEIKEVKSFGPPPMGDKDPRRYEWYQCQMLSQSPFKKSLYLDLMAKVCSPNSLQALFAPLSRRPMALGLRTDSLKATYNSHVLSAELDTRAPGIVAVNKYMDDSANILKGWCQRVHDQPKSDTSLESLMVATLNNERVYHFTPNEVCRRTVGSTCGSVLSVFTGSCYVVDAAFPELGLHWNEFDRIRLHKPEKEEKDEMAEAPPEVAEVDSAEGEKEKPTAEVKPVQQ